MQLISFLNVDKLYNYEKEDFTKDTDEYDFVFDAVGKSRFSLTKHLLKERGVYYSSEIGPGAENLYLTLKGKFFGKKKVAFPIPNNIPDTIATMKSMLESGQYKPIIEKSYPLDQINEAYAFVSKGLKTGNVILKLHG